MRDIRYNLALLFAGTLASVIGGLLFRPPTQPKVLWMLSLAVAALVLYGSNSHNLLRRWWAIRTRRGFLWIRPQIGILNDMGWDMRNKDAYSWTNISPETWESLMRTEASKLGRRVIVERITVAAHFEKYCAILNPYGGVYPESDLSQFITLGKVFDYVDSGGVFINVADVPGYYAYNKALRRRLDTTPVVFAPQPVPGGGNILAPMYPYQLTPFMQRLGIRVVGVENTPLATVAATIVGEFAQLVGPMQGTWLAHRVAFLEKNLDSVVAPAPAGHGNLVSPLLYAKMGQGKFLLCLLPLDQHQNARVPSLICGLTVASTPQ